MCGGGAGANREARAEARPPLGSTRSPSHRGDRPEESVRCGQHEGLAKNPLPELGCALGEAGRVRGCRIKHGKRARESRGPRHAAEVPLSSVPCSL